MTFEQIKLMAWNEERPDKLYAYHELCAYWTMYYISKSFKKCSFSKEKAADETKKAKNRFDSLSENYRQECANYKHLFEFWKNVEGPANDYAKSNNHTPEADRMYNVFYRFKEDAPVGKND